MRSGPKSKPKIKPDKGPSGGYGSLKPVAEILTREGLPVDGMEQLSVQNKPEGFMCVSCAWAKPAKPRRAVFMNRSDMARQGLAKDELVDLTTAVDDGAKRVVRQFQIVPYDIPEGCCGAYFPEANPLVPLSRHDAKAHTPAYKAIPVTVTRSASQARARPE
jgi:hypothetical protein